MTVRTAGRLTSRRVFGLTISPMSEADIAEHVGRTIRRSDAGVGLVVTPNIQHVAELRTNASFRDAYDHADIVTCDGFPVYLYARSRGALSPGRVTGRGIVTILMRSPDLFAHHTLFFVVADEQTATAVKAWATSNDIADRVVTDVPPFGFDLDQAMGADLAARIRTHGTTLLFMGLGAPKSEIFIDRHRAELPACWALCVGQAVKVALDLMPPPPQLVQSLNLEWLWRIGLEPKRLARRYVVSLAGFLAFVARDVRSGGGGTVSPSSFTGH
jgi:N-acetylglucosaminyldiphosphoundecaprenol N-acetyl-beta-D-mannosaminyltransferase